jgi:GT2 family glycosyltransferase
MKYSIVIPYYNRPEIRFALDTFVVFYANRDDLEIIIVEDTKNRENEEKHRILQDIITKYSEKLKITLILDPCASYNASTRYNRGVEVASGSIILITNPETPHTIDILKELDKVDFTNTYVVCACSAMHLVEDKGNFFGSQFKFYHWYQHSVHRNLLFHFCAAISKDNYNKIGGFDEGYSKGLAYEDANFVKRVEVCGLQTVTRDDLVTFHIEHSRDYGLNEEDTKRMIEINKCRWERQSSTNKFYE